MKNKIDVPVGISNDWEIARFEVTEDEAKFHNLREALHGSRRNISPGVYTRLTRRGNVIMSNTPAEIHDNHNLMRHVRICPIIADNDHILINGLGLGVTLQLVLDKPAIKHLTIIEKSEDVIALVAPHWKARYGDRLTIIHADAFDWQPPKNKRYGVVWHDIWDNITSDNLPEMHKLHRKYGRRCDWQGSWCRWECEQARRRGH